MNYTREVTIDVSTYYLYNEDSDTVQYKLTVSASCYTKTSFTQREIVNEDVYSKVFTETLHDIGFIENTIKTIKSMNSVSFATAEPLSDLLVACKEILKSQLAAYNIV